MEEYDALQLLDEAFIGKTDTLLQVEEQFGLLQKTAKKGQDLNSKPEVQKINRLIEKQFGMKLFALNIRQNSDLNASTAMISLRYDVGVNTDVRKLVVGSQESGYKFVSNNNLCVLVNMDLGLIIDETTTPSELVGTLLHEIGHNFAGCLNDRIRLENEELINLRYRYLIWKATVSFSKKYKKELEQNTSKYITKQAKDYQKKRPFRGWIMSLAGTKYNFIAFCKGVKNILRNARYNIDAMSKHEKKHMSDEQKNSTDRINEVFADKFVAVYGYSVEHARSLFKGDIHKTAAEKFANKIFGKDIVDTCNKLMQNYYLFDEHPDTIQRANHMMTTLKAELAKEDLDPKLKEVLKAQVDDMENFIKEITTASKNDSERLAVRKAFYKALNEESPSALAEGLEDEIEKELDDVLKET